MALSSTLFCDTCGAANRAQATFCSACGCSMHSPGSPHTHTGLLVQQHMLKSRYRILAQIGKGGFGAVYKAADTLFGNRTLAIKEMSQSSLNPQELHETTAAFKREAQLLAGLTHPNLPRIYEQFSETGRWYLVMDYIEGETLEVYLDKMGGKLPLDKVLDIGTQLASVLEYLHSHRPPIIFRDLKPANVMLTASGYLFLIDFGIARLFKPGQAKDTTALGSSGYAAPEQYGKAQTTPRTDIYSLGVTLHQLLSGNDPTDSPFHFAPLKMHGHPLLVDLDRLIMQMVEVDSNKRPASVTEVKQKLQHIATLYTVARTNPLPPTLPPGYQSVSSVAPLASPLVPAANPTYIAPRSKRTSVPQPRHNTLFICSAHTSRVTAVAWAPNNLHIASASYDKTVRLWNPANGQNFHTYRRHSDRVNALSWSPDSTRIASASDDRTVQVWEISASNPLFSFGGHLGKVLAVAWSPDGARVASAGTDNTVQVWEVSTGRVLFTFNGHTDRVTALAWSPDGKYIASAANDRTVQVWEWARDTSRNFFTSLLFHQRRVIIYRGHSQKVTGVAWSPDGRRIASTSNDKSMQLWDAITHRTGFLHRNALGSMNSVAWSPDSHFIASGGNDKTVQVWDAITRNSICIYQGHTGYVTTVAWSPDRSRLASGSVDHTLQIWQPR
jgi:WD40 repeat protein